MQIDLTQFNESYFEEATELIAVLEAGLLRLEAAPDEAEVLHEVFRAVHSLKGASGTLGLTDVARFAHAFEELLDHMRAGRVNVTSARIDLMLRGADLLTTLLAAARAGAPPPADLPAVLDEFALQHRSLRPAADPRAAAGAYRIVLRTGPGLLRHGLDPLLLLRELQALGSVDGVQVDASRLPELERMDPEACYLDWSLRLESELDRSSVLAVFAPVAQHCEVVVEGTAGRGAMEGAREGGERAELQPVDEEGTRRAASIRVSTAKVDQMIDLVGELVIVQSNVRQVLATFTAEQLPRLHEAVNALERNTRELQERALSVRMVPMSTVFGRFPRLVRDLAASSGKEIQLTLVGGDIELDKSVIEHITDPLMHLVRNSVDHGIETTGERDRAGKPGEGRIGLSAAHEGGGVLIEVADDGRGIDPERIRRKALSLGLIGAEDELGDDELRALIFLPGFSTAEVVSDVSGRGVGMDVVKRNVEALNGRLTIESTPGRGTRFQIRLPLTLAILDGLLLRTGSQTHVLPLLAVLEALRPRVTDLACLPDRGLVVSVRGEPVPLVQLGAILGVADAELDASRGLVVLVEHEGRRLGLLVDEVLGQAQVVVKDLESHFRHVEGVAGGTILGDGSAALILDVPGLTRLHERRARARADHSEARLLAAIAPGTTP